MSASVEKEKMTQARVFGHVLVGVDGSPESLEAARQAARLAEGDVTLLGAYDLAAALVGGLGMGAPAYLDEAPEQKRAGDAVERARTVIGVPAAEKIVRGTPWESLVRLAQDEDATLIAVGASGVGRMVGIFLGSTATEVVHKAPCSVLVARPAADTFPRKVVVGVDGSPQSAHAYDVARQVAERFGAELWPVVAHGGGRVERDAVDAIVDHRREDLPEGPVAALVAAGADADLVVVGSRGLHGVKALGSVSERVAHEAHSSVLVVR